MTILGVNVVGPDRAIVWADSAVTCDGEAAGETCKVIVNPLAGVIGVGTGLMAMTSKAASIVHRYGNLEDVAGVLPNVLRDAHRSKPALEARASALMAAYVITGYSAQLGRVVGWFFDAEDDFRPQLVAGWAAPQVVHHNVVDLQSCLSAAQQQVRRLRPPYASTGRNCLTVALLERGAITTCPPVDLATGARPARRSAA